MNHQQLDVFLEYTRRFDSIASDFPIELREGTPLDKKLKDKKAEKSETVQHAVIRYFNLCSEEYYLHNEKLIHDEIFEMWFAQLERCMKTDLFKGMWASARTSYNSAKSFQARVDSMAGA
jgi:hypothetical protein